MTKSNPKKPRSKKEPQPTPSAITLERVRQTLSAQKSTRFFATYEIIDLMNGWDGSYMPPNKSLYAARSKLQQAKGMTHHEQPTSAQAKALRKQLFELSCQGLVEMQRGGGRSNNSYSYRWITQALRDQKATRLTEGNRAKALARRMSLALGGDGESGVTPLINPDNTISVRVTLRETTAERLLVAIDDYSPDFFSGKHWEILTSQGEVMGCTADREDVRREEPDAKFLEVERKDCRNCNGAPE